MVLLSISFENMHQILRNLYDTMTKLCHPMMDMAMALAALGALFYIAYRVWQSLSRAEPIDVFSMLRPFVLGMCILFFDVMVLELSTVSLAPSFREPECCSVTRPSTCRSTSRRRTSSVRT